MQKELKRQSPTTLGTVATQADKVNLTAGEIPSTFLTSRIQALEHKELGTCNLLYISIEKLS